jgi:hypothetical protein
MAILTAAADLLSYNPEPSILFCPPPTQGQPQVPDSRLKENCPVDMR